MGHLKRSNDVLLGEDHSSGCIGVFPTSIVYSLPADHSLLHACKPALRKKASVTDISPTKNESLCSGYNPADGIAGLRMRLLKSHLSRLRVISDGSLHESLAATQASLQCPL